MQKERIFTGIILTFMFFAHIAKAIIMQMMKIALVNQFLIYILDISQRKKLYINILLFKIILLTFNLSSIGTLLKKL